MKVPYIWSIIFVLASSVSELSAQKLTQETLAPDTTIRMVKMKNGFTYYLKKIPSEITEVHFVVKAGYAYEEDDELQVAHIIEHMSSIETKRFKHIKQSLVMRGLDRGKDFNAYTGDMSTQYFVRVPSDSSSLLKMVIEYFKDCAQDVVMNSENIENARKVVLEESRGGIASKDTEIALMGNTIYAKKVKRDIMEGLETLNPSSLVNFYRKWYRAGRQALIVVGNINIEHLSRDIEDEFASLQGSLTRTDDFEAPDTSFFRWKNMVTISESRQGSSSVSVFLRRLHVPVRDSESLRHHLNTRLFNLMSKKRFQGQRSRLTPPFYEELNVLGPDIDVLVTRSSLDTVTVSSALKAVFFEHERIRRYGFSEQELDLAKHSLISDRGLLGAIDVQGYALQLCKHFVNGDLLINPILHSAFIRELINSITVDQINDMAKGWLNVNNNLAVIIDNAGKEANYIDISAVEELRHYMRSLHIAPYPPNEQETEVVAKNLLTIDDVSKISPPDKLRFYRDKFDSPSAVTILHLVNDIKVYLKPLTPSSVKRRGVVALKSVNSSPVRDGLDVFLAGHSGHIVSKSGLGTLTHAEFLQFLEQNKISQLSPYANGDEYGFIGYFDQNAIEKVMQAVYLYSVDPHVDEEVFSEVVKGVEKSSILANRHYSEVLEDTIKFLRGGFVQSTKDVCLNSISKDTVLNFFRDRYSITRGTAFVISGDFDLQNMIYHLVKYIGAIPAKESSAGKSSGSVDVKERDLFSQYIEITAKGPKVSDVNIEIEGEFDYSTRNRVILQLFQRYMDLRLFTRLREIEEGTYNVNVSLGIERRPSARFKIRINFLCDPSNVSRLVNSVKNEVQLAKIGDFDPSMFERLRKKQLEDASRRRDSPEFWVSSIIGEITNLGLLSNIPRELIDLEDIQVGDFVKFLSSHVNEEMFNIYVVRSLP